MSRKQRANKTKTVFSLAALLPVIAAWYATLDEERFHEILNLTPKGKYMLGAFIVTAGMALFHNDKALKNKDCVQDMQMQPREGKVPA